MLFHWNDEVHQVIIIVSYQLLTTSTTSSSDNKYSLPTKFPPCRSCSACNHSVAFKRMEIWKLPPILLINIKRFTFEGQWREKRQNYIDYPVRYCIIEIVIQYLQLLKSNSKLYYPNNMNTGSRWWCPSMWLVTSQSLINSMLFQIILDRLLVVIVSAKTSFCDISHHHACTYRHSMLQKSIQKVIL